MDHGQIIKFFGLLIISLYIYMKILDIKDVSKLKKVSAVIFSFIMSIPLSYTPFLYELIFLVSVFIFVSITMRVEINLMITTIIISVGISLGIEILANTILIFFEFLFLLVKALFENIPEEDISEDNINQILIIPLNVMPYISFIISTVFINFFFKIKRLKKGFIFLQSKEARWIGIIFSIIIMISRSFGGGGSIAVFVLLVINICTIGIHFWWRHHTTMLYQQRIKDRTIREKLCEIEEKDKQIEYLSECNKFLSETVHRDNKLIPAMYNAVSTFLYNSDINIETEMKTKGMHILSDLDEIMHERKETILKIQREHKSLPSTEMERIDNILNYMLLKASENEIQFDFIIAGSIKSIAESVIQKQKLETLLADLIENAIIAVSYSSYKRILIIMGIVDDYFEINVQDSGIPFEIETLINLGLIKSTTHADKGGSGIGYLSIFKILDESKASLIISEQVPEKYTFSKSIKVRFDSKSEFVIYSYRAEKIKPSAEREGYVQVYSFI